MKQQTGSKLGKEYHKTVYCHSVYLISMQSISCEMPSWMNHKLESRLTGEISTISDVQMIPLLMAESEEELKSLLMSVKDESEKKADLKLNIRKTKIVVSSPITSWQIERAKVEGSDRFYFLRLPNHCGWLLQQ